MAEPLGETEEISMKYVTMIEGREYLVDIIDEHRVSVDGVLTRWISCPWVTSRCIRWW